MRDDDPLARAGASLDMPLPNRFTRGTLLGCAGLLCVLAMPALLFVPIEQWAPPSWLALLVPLTAFALAALGAWLLARVPASAPMRSHDPAHPLTGGGAPPLLERPATGANRLAVASAAALLLTAIAGYALASAAGSALAGIEHGIALAGVAGVALIADGLLVAGKRVPVPALRWVRVPVQSGLSRQGAPLVLMGLVWVTWALWVALSAGIALGAAGLAVLTLVAVAAAPLARRLPPRGGASAGEGAFGRRPSVPDGRQWLR